MFGLKAIAATLLASAIILQGASTAYAGPAAGMARGMKSAPSHMFIAAKRPTLAPFAFIRFCRSHSADCEASQGNATIDLDQTNRRQLAEINASVNRSIQPTNDTDGQDQWDVDVASGDCEDFALTKRRLLISAGWQPGALRLAVVRTAEGEGHAVLVVKTSEGDLVLDNRTNAIRLWNRAGLTWLKIQSEQNPKLWYEI
jgi:predicted transglutaminase-like cysteine proteinase